MENILHRFGLTQSIFYYKKKTKETAEPIDNAHAASAVDKIVTP